MPKLTVATHRCCRRWLYLIVAHVSSSLCPCHLNTALLSSIATNIQCCHCHQMPSPNATNESSLHCPLPLHSPPSIANVKHCHLSSPSTAATANKHHHHCHCLAFSCLCLSPCLPNTIRLHCCHRTTPPILVGGSRLMMVVVIGVATAAGGGSANSCNRQQSPAPGGGNDI
jgi:hypothetical protein